MKKGQYKPIQKLLFFLATLLVLLIPLGVFGQSFMEDLPRKQCYQSATNQATFSIAEKKILNLLCPTYELQFTDTEITVTKNEKERTLTIVDEGKKKKDFKELKENYVNQVLANELALCWEQFGEGKLNVFNEFFFTGLFENSETVCFPCNTIIFALDEQITYTNLLNYVKSTPYYQTDQTYYIYLDFNSPETGSPLKTLQEAKIPLEISLDSSKIYYIVFLKQGVSTFKTNYYATWVMSREDYNNKCDRYVAAYKGE